MDKRTKNRIEREKLKSMIANNPKLLAFLEAASDFTPEDKSLAEMIEPCIKDSLERHRNEGLMAGFRTCLMSIPAKLKEYTTLEDAIAYFEGEAEKSKAMLGIKPIEEIEVEHND